MSNPIGDNINAIRVDLGLSQEQLAEKAGVSQTTVSSWECGMSQPRRTNLQRLSDALDLPYDSIVSSEKGYAATVFARKRAEEANTPQARAQAAEPLSAPVLGFVAAGDPSRMYRIDERFFVPPAIKDRHPKAFFLRVHGASMNRTLPDGCLALIDPTQIELNEHDAFAVRVGTEEATIKRVRTLENGIELLPDSTDPTFRPKLYDRGDERTPPIIVLGRVVWMTAPLGYRC